MALLTQTPQQYYNNPNSWGNYQFISLREIIDQFMVVYVGEEKIISKAKRLDVAFHAQRALAELSYDVFRSCKSHELILSNNLCTPLPQDFVNYRKISWVDKAGIKHRIYPTNCSTNNPGSSPYQDEDGEFEFEVTGTLTAGQPEIVLDDSYPNLSGGIYQITSPSLDATGYTWYIGDNSTNGTTNSTLLLYDQTDPTSIINGQFKTFISTLTQTEIFTIKRVDGSLMTRRADGVVINGCTMTSYVDQFAQTHTNRIVSTNSVSNVEVGMTVWTAANSTGIASFPLGTKVTQVDTTNNVIFLDNDYLIPTSGLLPTNTDFLFTGLELESRTLGNYQSTTPSENQHQYDDDTFWPLRGERYGIEPQFANANGTFNIDECKGKICFSSNLNGATIVIDYISDGLGTEEEMVVPKLGEEAMYKWILYAIISSRQNTPEYQVRRFKKEKFAEVRRAKIRISNLKLEEVTQVLRGKSKQIKH